MVSKKHLIAIFCFLIVCAAGIITLKSYYGDIFYRNDTLAGPTGIYVRVFEKNPTLQKGDYVITTLPQQNKDIVLLKVVAGVAGETYEVNPYAMLMDGKAYPIDKEFPVEQKLKPGTYTIPDDTVLLLCNYDLSIDSRYFGPFPKEEIICKVKPLFSFD